MKRISSLILKSIGYLAVLTLMLSANTTSAWLAHQPKVPKGIKKFKKV